MNDEKVTEAQVICLSRQMKLELLEIDGDKLNNFPDNLRITTPSYNSGKAKPRNNSTGFAGVTRTKNGKFQAKIKVDGKSMALGTYENPEDAYSAYCDAKVRYFGQEALLHLS